MKRSHVAAGSRPIVRSVAPVAATVALFAIGLTLVLTASAQAAATAVGLGTADSFVVLAGAGVTNTGATTLNGDLGTYPTKTIKGGSTITVNGTNHAGDNVTKGAKDDLVTAYNVAAGEKPPIPIAGDLGGQTLTRGVYNSASTIGLTGTVTLNAEGDAGAVFVFQAGSSITTASASRVLLENGAQACNVFWQIGASATLGTGSTFVGSVLALTSITAKTTAKVQGRLLARNGTVTLETNTITRPACLSTPPPTVTATPTGGPTVTATPTVTPTDTPTRTATASPTITGTAPGTVSPTATTTSAPTSTATAPGTVSPTATTTSAPTSTTTSAPTSTATAPGTVSPTPTASGSRAHPGSATSTTTPSAQVTVFPNGAPDTGSYTDGTNNGTWAGLAVLVLASAAAVVSITRIRGRN